MNPINYLLGIPGSIQPAIQETWPHDATVHRPFSVIIYGFTGVFVAFGATRRFNSMIIPSMSQCERLHLRVDQPPQGKVAQQPWKCLTIAYLLVIGTMAQA